MTPSSVVVWAIKSPDRGILIDTLDTSYDRCVHAFCEGNVGLWDTYHDADGYRCIQVIVGVPMTPPIFAWAIKSPDGNFVVNTRNDTEEKAWKTSSPKLVEVAKARGYHSVRVRIEEVSP